MFTVGSFHSHAYKKLLLTFIVKSFSNIDSKVLVNYGILLLLNVVFWIKI